MADIKRAKSARKVATSDQSEKQRYWIGTLDGAPKQNIYINGVGFLRFSEMVTPSDDDPRRRVVGGKRPGMIVRLTQKEVEDVKTRAELSVVRWADVREIKDINPSGKEVMQQYRRGKVISLAEVHENAPAPVQLPTDEPITKYIYLKPMSTLPEGFQPGYGMKLPDSLWDDMEKTGENQKRRMAREAAEAKADETEKKAELAQVAAKELVKKL